MDLRARLQSVAPVSGRQFAAFRIALGVYLTIHFAALVPWGRELFSRDGALANARLNPIYGLLPNVLATWDSPGVVTTFLLAMTALAVMLAFGMQRRIAAVALWYGWACLFNRNVLIGNPALPYVGFLVLSTAIVPSTEPWRAFVRRVGGAPQVPFQMPGAVWLAAWSLMALGYAFSAGTKLFSPSWIDGTALWHALHGPLARVGWARNVALALPAGLLEWATWEALALEALFLPLALWRVTRPVAWLTMCAVQLGMLAVVGATDLSAGMLLLHGFTFDPRWLALLRRWRSGATTVSQRATPAIAA